MDKTKKKTIILSIIAVLLLATVVIGILLMCSPKFHGLLALKSTVDEIKSDGTFEAEIINLNDNSVLNVLGSHNGLDQVNGLLNSKIEFYFSPDRGLIVNVTDVVRGYVENAESNLVHLISYLLNKDIWVKYSDVAAVTSTDGSETSLGETMDYINEIKSLGISDLNLTESVILDEEYVLKTDSGIQIGVDSFDSTHISLYIPDLYLVHATFIDNDVSIDEPDIELSNREVEIIASIYSGIKSLRE